ncbi:PilW family protein [Methylomarinum vadi]|uniref:PilW family protein n=1 Tax=Methylomarinum vadi TaxID=438855 RepID=UPI0004DF29D9|nr:prepilin-type N-terminal cleavage/methylation domain-containing protein [Methylomarinum vadi]
MNKNSGLTLIEILIALVLGLLVIGTTITLYIMTVKSSNDTLQSTRLNHDLDSVLSLMMNDIKRAGYWGNAVINADSRNNPFTVNPTTDIQIRNLAAPTTVADPGNCILYSYDANDDGVVDNNEHYGFRLSNNSIDIRKSGVTNDNCNDAGNDDWEEIVVGDELNITNLQFSMLPLGALNATTRCMNFSPDPSTSFNTTCDVADNTAGNINSGDTVVEKRIVNISVTGTLDNDAAVTKTLTGTVQVRNERIFTQP